MPETRETQGTQAPALEEQVSQQRRRQTLEQERGRVAWADVTEVKDSALEKEYRSLARGLNAMIQINGLGQTLGFLKAKGKGDSGKAHYLLLNHLTGWMKDQNHFSAGNLSVMNNGPDGFLQWVTDAGTSSTDYRRATTECLAFGLWLRRFAEAELKGED
jgi:CRISPR-associated protein Cmr5